MTTYAHNNSRREAVYNAQHQSIAFKPVTGTATDFKPGEFSLETPSGTFLDLVDPNPEDIKLEDIAHSLSQINRFGGHTKYPYSVAEHTVRVSEKLKEMGFDASTQMAGLHHDDAEYCLGDIPTPLKKLFGYSYRSLTREIDQAIWEAIAEDGETWSLPQHLWEVEDFQSAPVKLADAWALCCEAHELMSSRGAGWADTHPWGAVDPNAATYGWDPETAELAWVMTHDHLREEILGG